MEVRCGPLVLILIVRVVGLKQRHDVGPALRPSERRRSTTTRGVVHMAATTAIAVVSRCDKIVFPRYGAPIAHCSVSRAHV